MDIDAVFFVFGVAAGSLSTIILYELKRSSVDQAK